MDSQRNAIFFIEKTARCGQRVGTGQSSLNNEANRGRFKKQIYRRGVSQSLQGEPEYIGLKKW